jgi:ribosomal protein L11 methylase PrmA
VRPGGTLVLSGILATDATRVTAAMAAQGFARRRVSVERDWCLLACTRR